MLPIREHPWYIFFPAYLDFDIIGVDLDTVIGILEGVVPSVSNIFSIQLGLSDPFKAELFVYSCLDFISAHGNVISSSLHLQGAAETYSKRYILLSSKL